jgi:hypothetical protein
MHRAPAARARARAARAKVGGVSQLWTIQNQTAVSESQHLLYYF